MKHVKMTRDAAGPHGPLKAGKTVTMADHEAAKLVAAGAATYCRPDGKPPATEKANTTPAAAPPPTPEPEPTPDEPGPRDVPEAGRRDPDRGR